MLTSLQKSDALFPFRKVTDTLKKADIVFGNLENPSIKNCPIHNGGFTFCTTYQIADGLTFAGVDVVTLANNHAGNYGQKGVEETAAYLKENGILVTGMGELAAKEVNGTVFGFLGFEYVFKPANPKHLELVKKSDPLVDVLIVGVHWGDEYKSKANDLQRNLAREFIKNGADVVVGHHPHWVQTIECFDMYQGVKGDPPSVWAVSATKENDGCPPNSKPVYYSLGNFIFDQMWSEETKKGIVVELTFEDGKFVEDKLLKTYIRETGQPEFVN